MRFELPWALTLLLILPLFFWWSRERRSSGSLKFSSVANAKRIPPSWRMRLRHVPTVLRVLTLALLATCLARPQQGRERLVERSEGIAMEMVVDRSGSMGQEMAYRGSSASRLDVVKEVFKEFVLGNGKDLRGRPNDLIGMVAFARYADTVCPLTLSHGALERFMENLRVVTRKSEDGTAVGDGLALAAARLQKAEEALKRRSPSAKNFDYKIKSKVIILLTDGRNNAGKRSPLEGAKLARQWGIKIHTIGIGGTDSFVTLQTPMGDYRAPAGPGVEEEALRMIAEETGGVYRLAATAQGLRDIYEEIDRLERSPVESAHYSDYAEKFPPFAVAALAALLLEQILSSTVFRRIP